jgi:hypothetical protein
MFAYTFLINGLQFLECANNYYLFLFNELRLDHQVTRILIEAEIAIG